MNFYKSKKKKQLENEAAVLAFMNDYREVTKKHCMDFALHLDYSKQGIRPVAKVIKIELSEPKTDIK